MSPTSLSLHGPPPSVHAAAGVQLLWSWVGLWGWSSPDPCRPWDAAGPRSADPAALCSAEPSSDTRSAQITAAYTAVPLPTATKKKQKNSIIRHLCLTITHLSAILNSDWSTDISLSVTISNILEKKKGKRECKQLQDDIKPLCQNPDQLISKKVFNLKQLVATPTFVQQRQFQDVV